MPHRQISLPSFVVGLAVLAGLSSTSAAVGGGQQQVPEELA